MTLSISLLRFSIFCLYSSPTPSKIEPSLSSVLIASILLFRLSESVFLRFSISNPPMSSSYLLNTFLSPSCGLVKSLFKSFNVFCKLFMDCFTSSTFPFSSCLVASIMSACIVCVGSVNKYIINRINIFLLIINFLIILEIF